MPKYPDFSSTVQGISGSVFSALAARIADFPGEVYPLHVGDTWLEPAIGARMEDLQVADHPGMHRYATPHGLPELIATLHQRVAERTGIVTSADSVLMTTGATGALGAVTGALLEPGDEVLILAPYWPLIAGIVRAARARAVAVPVFERNGAADDTLQRLDGAVTRRTVALYLNTPNNPSGHLLPPALLEEICGWARRRGLWLLSDEVYEDLQYSGEPAYCRRYASERTFSAYSFSKAFGMAGNRCGYLVGPAAAMAEVRKVSTHTFYSAPTAGQLAAQAVLSPAGDGWLEAARRRYSDLGRRAAESLDLPAPAGGTFLFFDVSAKLDERGLLGFLEDCADHGLFLAPGPSFGPFPNHVRLCFTSASPEVVERGVEVLRKLLSGA
ncbi:MAG: pyridoxal phosphate-dependent aminotransferase [Acidobacteriota bacterium]